MQQIKKVKLRFVIRKPKVFFFALVTMVSVYLLLIFYLACYQLPPQDHKLSPHLFGHGAKRLYQKVYTVQSIKRPIHVQHNCSEQLNFVFIKGMKCATSTLLGVFYRFGYTRNLSFVSPLANRIYLNWPFPVTLRDFRPSSLGYNILTDHSIYTEDVMEAIMPRDTVYISIIREPFTQLKSIFQYFKIAKVAGVPENIENPVVEYFSNLEKYESVYKSPVNKARWCIPDGFSMTKNLMSHCHGMPLGFPPGTKDISNDTKAIEQYIQHLDSKFSLIMISEYFYESLVLLRRLMCWSFKDIVFINANVAKYDFKTTTIPEAILDLHRNWSSADYALYRYFNNTFWQHISRQGSDFYSEVETFKAVETQVMNYCQKLYSSFTVNGYPANMTETLIKETTWNIEFSITSKDCWMLGPNPYELIHVVQKENDKREANLLEEQSKIPDNRTVKSIC